MDVSTPELMPEADSSCLVVSSNLIRMFLLFGNFRQIGYLGKALVHLRY